MSLGRIDRLPVELLHAIFTYLSAHDIYYAFSNLNDYLDSVLVSYPHYLINFRSVLKSNFDVTCHRIRPHQVISLTLSDDDDTPDQSELFFSLFNIEQFIHLRSFDMSSMSDNTCKQLSHLHKLKYLSSLELPCLFQPYFMPFHHAILELLPQLNRLAVYNTEYLLTNALPHLRHLTLRHCNCWQLATLFKLIPNLYSLDIIFSFSDSDSTNWSNNVPILPHLRRLVLNIYGEQVTMTPIEQFLSKIPNLLHFELDTQGYQDLIDGERLESLVSNLTVFNFRFCLQDSPSCSEENILHSFRSLFWLEQKRWFVAYDGPYLRQIFTVPRFAPNTVIYRNIYWPPLCTSPHFCFDQYIHQVHLSLSNLITHRFTNVTSLIFDSEEIVTNLVSTSFLNLIERLSHLHSLSFRFPSVLACLSHDVVFKTIRTLHVQNAYDRPKTGLKLDLNE